MMVLGGFVGWVVSMVAFAFAVGYVASRIDEVRDGLRSLERNLASVERAIDLSRDTDIERQLGKLHETLADGMAALVAIGKSRAGERAGSFSEDEMNGAYETLSAFGWVRLMRMQEASNVASPQVETDGQKTEMISSATAPDIARSDHGCVEHLSCDGRGWSRHRRRRRIR